MDDHFVFDVVCLTIASPRPSNVWYVVDRLTSARIQHTSTYYPNDHSVLIAGGFLGSPLITIEKYLPSTGCFQAGLSMPRARRSHTSDILPAFPDHILFAGGVGTSIILNSADLFNPNTGQTLTLPLTSGRYAHESALFGSSQLAVIGGINSAGTHSNTGDAMFSGLNSTFFSVTNTLNSVRIDHTVTRLGNQSGLILVVGGQYLSTSELFYGASNVFIPLGSGGTMSSARAYHTATYFPSLDKVLIIGGHTDGWNSQNTMTLFDVPTLSFTSLTSTMSTRRSWHTATLLSNGKVLVVGGHNNSITLTSCELVDPLNNYLVTPVANLNIARLRHTATLIPDNSTGTVLICGGTTNGVAALDTCELYVV